MAITATVAMRALVAILTERLGDAAEAVREARKVRRAVGEEGLAAYVAGLDTHPR